MKKKARFLMIASLIAIFSCVVMPVVNAETLDIGTMVNESDQDSRGYRWYYFDSGCMIWTNPDYIDNVPLIFDGNESTGIDHNFSAGHDRMLIYLVFPDSFYVNNITFKPIFGGNASDYHNGQLLCSYSVEYWFYLPYSEEKTIHINGTIDTLRLWLDSNGTDHFYFNDVIINYTPAPSIADELQEQINNLTEQFIFIDYMINQLNNSINELNQTQYKIIENVTNLSASYYQLNESFTTLVNDIDNLDSRVFQLESENAALGLEIENLTSEIETLKTIEREKIIEKQPDNTLVYAAFVLGILGIIIALVAIIIISKKLSSQTQPAEKEKSRDSITPQQQKENEGS